MSCNVTELANGIKDVLGKAVKKVTSTANAIRMKYVSKESPPSTVSETDTETNLPPAASSLPPLIYGKVTSYSDAKGYGFITSDGGQTGILVHYSDIEMYGFKTLEKGQKVSFGLAYSDNPEKVPKAINVRLLN